MTAAVTTFFITFHETTSGHFSLCLSLSFGEEGVSSLTVCCGGGAQQEQAAVEFVEQIDVEAKAQLEEEWNHKAETLMTTVARSQQQQNFGADVPVVASDLKSNSK